MKSDPLMSEACGENQVEEVFGWAMNYADVIVRDRVSFYQYDMASQTIINAVIHIDYMSEVEVKKAMETKEIAAIQSVYDRFYLALS